jgi:hypothetical protein
MKKIILIAGLAGIMVTGALAQTGNRSSTAVVSVSVDTYMNISAITGSFSFTVTDGGFSSTYASGGAGSFTATANVAHYLHATVTGLGAYTILSKLDAGSFASTADEGPLPITNGTSHSVDVQLQGNTSTGLPPDAGSSGVVTVTIASS